MNIEQRSKIKQIHEYASDHLRSWFPSLLKDMACSGSSQVLTPVKAVKNQPEIIKQWDMATNDLYSRAVSSVRQSIKLLFNRIIEKRDIQRALKVRSIKGLPVHVFGRIAVAVINIFFNS